MADVFYSIAFDLHQIRPLHDKAVDEWFEDSTAQAEAFDPCPRLDEDCSRLGRVGTEEEAGDGGQNDADAGAGTVGEDEVGTRLEERHAVPETEEGGVWCSQERLVDSSCAADCNNLISFVPILEVRSFGSREVVPGTDHVGAA